MERSRLNQIIKEELDRVLRESGRLKTRPPSKVSKTPNDGEVWKDAEGNMYLVVGIPYVDHGDSDAAGSWTATADLIMLEKQKEVVMNAGEWHFVKKLESF